MGKDLLTLAKTNPSIVVLMFTSLLSVGVGFNLAIKSFEFLELYSLVFITLGLAAFVLLANQVLKKRLTE